MKRKTALISAFCILISVLPLTGCWDYRGLNELSVVTGFAVDFNQETEAEGEFDDTSELKFQLTFEVLDFMDVDPMMPLPVGTQLLVTHGATIAEAVHNASNQLHNSMYLGNAAVALVSRAVAEEVGLDPLLEYLLRSRDARNTLKVVVTATDTAAELLGVTPSNMGGGNEDLDENGENEEDDGGEPEEGGGKTVGMVSTALSEALSGHQRGTQHNIDARTTFEIYNIISTGTSDLALPFVGQSDAEDRPFQMEGLALFTGERMTGTLAESDMPLYRLAASGLHGGQSFALEMPDTNGNSGRVVLLNRQSRPHITFDREQGNLHFHLNISMRADIISIPPHWNRLDSVTVRQIEQAASAEISAQVAEFLNRLHEEQRDIIGLAETIRNRDFRLWDELAQEGGRGWLAESEMTVRAQVEIHNTGMIGEFQ